MELKVVCDCGQKYKFDVEPKDGLMPFTVNCPVCGIDGTSSANNLISTVGPQVNRVLPAPSSVPSHVTPASVPIASPGTMRQPAPPIPKYLQTNPATANNSFLMGTLGALVGAALSVTLMIAFYRFTGFRFPLTGTLMGAVIGCGARLMYKGTSSTLGAMSGAIAFVTILSTLYLLFGFFGVLLSGLVSLIVGVGIAFNIASG